ncbi:MAG: hypothetical protein KDA85_12855, partial [Planctomycetaceae bacterium]|nr:hypothetical protein [Planctomycetaceae bacterium]
PVFQQLAIYDWVKLNRLAEVLTPIGQASDWAALVVAELLQSFISGWRVIPRNAHHVLELLLTLLVQLERAPAAEVLEKLASIAGKSKTATLASRLRELHTVARCDRSEIAILDGIRIAVQRAIRRCGC